MFLSLFTLYIPAVWACVLYRIANKLTLIKNSLVKQNTALFEEIIKAMTKLIISLKVRYSGDV